MAYDEKTVGRIRKVLQSKGVEFEEKKMFSGVCFMVDEKMCCGSHIDKKSGENFLLCRLGEEATQKALEGSDCIPMEFTGKAMKDYVFVLESGIRDQKSLEGWIQQCLDYNPKAKKSKK